MAYQTINPYTEELVKTFSSVLKNPGFVRCVMIHFDHESGDFHARAISGSRWIVFLHFA
jgi:hypothetical protein